MRHGRLDYQARIVDLAGVNEDGLKDLMGRLPDLAGTGIPEDEPVLLLRGQDVFACGSFGNQISAGERRSWVLA